MASKSPAAAGRTGRRRGQPHTRQQILDAARELFAERGYAGTSMRAIGAAAGVDPALVHHYFGTKEELFRAVLDVPVDPEVLLRQIGGASGAETPARFVQTFLNVWDSAETGPQMVSLARRVFADQRSTEMLRDFFGATVIGPATAALLVDTDRKDAEARVALVVSQMLGVVLLRRVVALEPLASMPVEQLTAALVPTIARYLDGALPARPTQDPPSTARPASNHRERKPTP
ncbi:MAG TPA: TetR family transcriptional regulator [Dermatophilaceae bacterium]|nr:TetR family transcriptional regulator [Dermatophilaceae bacterium]